MSFIAIFPEKIPEAIQRYQNETRRLYGILDRRLENNEYLVGEFSIADIAHWCWARIHGWAGVWIEEFPHLQRWIDQIAARPGCAKGVCVPHATDFSGDKAEKFIKGAQNIVTR